MSPAPSSLPAPPLESRLRLWFQQAYGDKECLSLRNVMAALRHWGLASDASGGYARKLIEAGLLTPLPKLLPRDKQDRYGRQQLFTLVLVHCQPGKSEPAVRN